MLTILGLGNAKTKMIPAATRGNGGHGCSRLCSNGFENLPVVTGVSSFSAGSPVTNGGGLCTLDISLSLLLLPVSYPEIVCVK